MLIISRRLGMLMIFISSVLLGAEHIQKRSCLSNDVKTDEQDVAVSHCFYFENDLFFYLLIFGDILFFGSLLIGVLGRSELSIK